MSLRNRVVRLERVLPPPTPEEVRKEQRWLRILRRLDRLLKEAKPLLSPSEQEAINRALDGCMAWDSSPMDKWLTDLVNGRCRLPLLPPPVTREFMLNWLRPDIDHLMVCNRCGLESPRLRSHPPQQYTAVADTSQLTELGPFEHCLGCGAPADDALRPYLTHNKDLPWKALDGWMGAKPVDKRTKHAP